MRLALHIVTASYWLFLFDNGHRLIYSDMTSYMGIRMNGYDIIIFPKCYSASYIHTRYFRLELTNEKEGK